MDSRLILFAGLLVGATLAWWLPRALRRRRLGLRFARSRRLEAEGSRMLADAGYEVLATQVTAPCVVSRNGEPIEADIRADYLVSRWGRMYVAEAKSGPRATDLRERATRRQLLEYAVTYDVDGVLLVDTEAGEVVQVAFPALARRAQRAFWAGAGVGASVGAGAMAAAWWHLRP
ncbi:MAG: hypothetical protein Q8P18_01325 [Pseudomonadota bacterium]|nr:hypothetical protein [Pseudomonadota bacterium]